MAVIRQQRGVPHRLRQPRNPCAGPDTGRCLRVWPREGSGLLVVATRLQRQTHGAEASRPPSRGRERRGQEPRSRRQAGPFPEDDGRAWPCAMRSGARSPWTGRDRTPCPSSHLRCLWRPPWGPHKDTRLRTAGGSCSNSPRAATREQPLCPGLSGAEEGPGRGPGPGGQARPGRHHAPPLLAFMLGAKVPEGGSDLAGVTRPPWGNQSLPTQCPGLSDTSRKFRPMPALDTD